MEKKNIKNTHVPVDGFLPESGSQVMQPLDPGIQKVKKTQTIEQQIWNCPRKSDLPNQFASFWLDPLES